MSILHTVNSSPFQTFSLQQCLAVLCEKDTLLLIEDGVIASKVVCVNTPLLQQLAEEGRLMVLEPDSKARAINKFIGKSCSYADFVSLVCNHQSQIAW